MNLADLSKLPPAMQRAVMADQARATAARERIMAKARLIEAVLAEPSRTVFPSPAPAVKTPAKPVSVAGPWLPASVLHAIPHPNYGSPSSAQPKPPVFHEPLGPAQGETLYSGRVHVRITSYRRRLLDPDNLTAKFFLDACRYARLIRDDKPEDITYQVGQEKVARKEDERTEVVIEPL